MSLLLSDIYKLAEQKGFHPKNRSWKEDEGRKLIQVAVA
jgi:hypothetical protein